MHSIPDYQSVLQRKWKIPLLADTMARDRYFLLRAHLKLVFDLDITDDTRKQDKLWKLRPLLDRIITGCQNLARDRNVCVDEMIVPFTGSLGIKQFVKGKPNPVGLKVFVLANPNGLVLGIYYPIKEIQHSQMLNTRTWELEQLLYYI